MRSPETPAGPEQARKWGDLKARILTAIAMVAVGGGAIWAGGWWILALMVLVLTVMLWELGRLLTPGQPVLVLVLADLGGLMFLAMTMTDVVPWFMFLAIAPILGAILFVEGRLIYLCYGIVITFSTAAILFLRQDLGLNWILWFLAVVIVTDIAGYFVGRLVGGPKFWPRISPKKTWSGTAGGWAGAALVGAGFAEILGVGPWLVGLSVALSFASQLGDIAESAIKRATGVKDSSNLLPGHGGVLDRFDGMIGAAAVLLVVVIWAPGLFGVA